MFNKSNLNLDLDRSKGVAYIPISSKYKDQIYFPLEGECSSDESMNIEYLLVEKGELFKSTFGRMNKKDLKIII